MPVGVTRMPAGATTMLADVITMPDYATTMRVGVTRMPDDAITMPEEITTVPAGATTSGSGASTSPARGTTSKNGWLWRKMSKIGTGAKRRWRSRFRALSSAMRDFRLAEGSNGETMVDIFQNFSYYVLWVLEGVVVVVGFCVFFLRFGGRL